MACNTEKNFVQPTAKTITGIATAVQNILTEERTSPRLLLSLIDRMISGGQLLPLAKLERRPLQYLLKELWEGDIESLDGYLPIAPAKRSTVIWWADPLNLDNGVPIQDSRDQVLLLTDSSPEGWGAHLDDHMVSGKWSQLESQAFINVLELWAVERTLLAFQNLLVLSDNSIVVSHITKEGGTRSFTLYRERSS
jgi:hypothetical protein